MKFNVSYPLTGGQKTYEIDDDKKCSIFYDKRMGQEVDADQLGDEFKGYIFKITGGNDKQGFPMRQGIFVKGRVRILMRKGQKGYRPRRTGEQKRKSIRGCIVGPDIRILCLSIVKKGDKDLEGKGVTTVNIARRLGPKRLSKLRRLFGVKKTVGVALIKKNIIRRTWTNKDGKKRQKAPKIQRLVTEERLRRKKVLYKLRDVRRKARRQEAEAYKKLLHDYIEQKKKLRRKSSDVQENKDKKPVATQPAKGQPQQAKGKQQQPTGKQAPQAKGKGQQPQTAGKQEKSKKK